MYFHDYFHCNIFVLLSAGIARTYPPMLVRMYCTYVQQNTCTYVCKYILYIRRINDAAQGCAVCMYCTYVQYILTVYSTYVQYSIQYICTVQYTVHMYSAYVLCLYLRNIIILFQRDALGGDAALCCMCITPEYVQYVLAYVCMYLCFAM